VAGRGRVRLNLLYDEDKEELKVFVHEAAGLPGGDLPDPPDPQVKIYLMPGKKKKKKTEVVKDSVEPRYNEEFDFSIDYSALPKHSLKVCVVDRKGVFSKSPVLGTTTISLDNPGLKRGLADWFPLVEDDDDSD
jgi:Ca2+-dependent lipid-binding protein